MNEDARRAGRPGFEEIEDGLYLLKSPFATIWSGVFLVRGPLNVLVDSGCSAEVADGVIMPALEDIGIAPEDIKWVINTHSHGDHVNGNTRLLERTGALLAAYVSRVTDSSGSFKANISAVFIADNLFRIILYSVIGIITLPVLKQVLILLPFMLIGLFAGMLLAKHLNERLIKKLVILLLIVSGIALILNQLLA